VTCYGYSRTNLELVLGVVLEENLEVVLGVVLEENLEVVLGVVLEENLEDDLENMDDISVPPPLRIAAAAGCDDIEVLLKGCSNHRE
jgi:hypothetical protein